jgi:hypothetical protein
LSNLSRSKIYTKEFQQLNKIIFVYYQYVVELPKLCRWISGQEIFSSVTDLTFVSQQSHPFLAAIGRGINWGSKVMKFIFNFKSFNKLTDIDLNQLDSEVPSITIKF